MTEYWCVECAFHDPHNSATRRVEHQLRTYRDLKPLPKVPPPGEDALPSPPPERKAPRQIYADPGSAAYAYPPRMAEQGMSPRYVPLRPYPYPSTPRSGGYLDYHPLHYVPLHPYQEVDAPMRPPWGLVSPPIYAVPGGTPAAFYASPRSAAYASPRSAGYLSPPRSDPHSSPRSAAYASPRSAAYLSPRSAAYLSPRSATHTSPRSTSHPSPRSAAHASPRSPEVDAAPSSARSTRRPRPAQSHSYASRRYFQVVPMDADEEEEEEPERLPQEVRPQVYAAAGATDACAPYVWPEVDMVPVSPHSRPPESECTPFPPYSWCCGRFLEVPPVEPVDYVFPARYPEIHAPSDDVRQPRSAPPDAQGRRASRSSLGAKLSKQVEKTTQNFFARTAEAPTPGAIPSKAHVRKAPPPPLQLRASRHDVPRDIPSGWDAQSFDEWSAEPATPIRTSALRAPPMAHLRS
ncbi:hypothetical protein SCP_0501460 [Sparassis crispa]|uniref:Uncharacterized protein n=1 Tax=Sparassis crispa TaxID=139825 RepID=A0A401GLT3_9APHY|nr:hypothetical protein SCP_0501460 [Sparassis crispa]GBE83099.1 hypothetical protein SCP_0501460 [Sparassis crispa]